MVRPSNLYSTVYSGSGTTFFTRVKKASSSSEVTALSRLYRRAMCAWREKAFSGSPPTLRVGLSGRTVPVCSSSFLSSS